MSRSAKEIRVEPISGADARTFVKHWHYSGSVMQQSQLHFGAFLDGRLHGALQFGPCIDKRKIQPLVTGTGWNGFLELNRMAFDEILPKNSESRVIAICFRLIKKHYPHIKWVISFADACQCGDGQITELRSGEKYRVVEKAWSSGVAGVPDSVYIFH